MDNIENITNNLEDRFAFWPYLGWQRADDGDQDWIYKFKDHYWYLLIVDGFETPVKAEFHDDGGCHFIWYGLDKNGTPKRYCAYEWDDQVLYAAEFPSKRELISKMRQAVIFVTEEVDKWIKKKEDQVDQ
jgi:hypothetical protein